MPSLIGNKPNQVPSNGDLGTLAFQDASNPKVENLAYTGTLTGGTGVVNLGSGQFYKAADGKIGVGTASPSQRLTVAVGDASQAVSVQGTTGRVRIRPYQDATNGAIIDTTNTAESVYSPLTITASTLRLFGNNATGATIDSSGNLGLGVTPSAWSSDYKAIQIGQAGTIYSYSVSSANSNMFIGENIYINSAGTYAYIRSDLATSYRQGDGTHQWLLAPSGTAGATATFTQAMTLDANGNLGIGTTTPASYGKLAITGNLSSTTSGTYFLDGTTSGNPANPTYSWVIDTNTGMYRPQADHLGLVTGGTERMRIDSSGNLLVGKTSATANGGDLQVSSGITFPATQVAKTDANTLDDYEEGTWTPVVKDGAAGNAATAGTTVGRYTKIGNTVCITIALVDITTTGLTAGNQIHITGLPFNAINVSLAYQTFAVGKSIVSSTTGCVTATCSPNTTYLLLSNQTTAGSSSLVVSSITSGSGDLYIQGTYLST